MSVIIKSGNSSDLLTVNTSNQALVNLPSTLALQPGFVDIAGEVSDGTAPLSGMTPVVRTNRRITTTQQGHVTIGQDIIFFYDNFNHATLNASTYRGVDTTMTKAVSGGFLNFNSGNSVTAGQATQVSTYRTFNWQGDSAIQVDIWIQLSQTPQANNVCEWGVGFVTGVATPTDGVYFRLTNTATLECVLCINGVETTTAVTGATLAANTTYHTFMSITQDSAQFFFDDRLVCATQTKGAAAPGVCLSQNVPMFAREWNSNTVGTAQQFRIAAWQVSGRDFASAKLWNESMAGSGLHSITTPPGVATATQTANYVLNTAPVALTLATNGGYPNLGGQWQAVMVAGAETDYGIFNYQNQTGSATIPGRNLFISNIRVGETFNTVAANAATPIILQWAAGVGSTASAISTADSLTAGTRSPRRVVLGGQQFATGAVIGTMSPGFSFEFKPPVLVEPATYAQIYMRVISGTATGNSIRGSVVVSGNWE